MACPGYSMQPLHWHHTQKKNSKCTKKSAKKAKKYLNLRHQKNVKRGDVGATIHTCWGSQCLPYAGFVRWLPSDRSKLTKTYTYVPSTADFHQISACQNETQLFSVFFWITAFFCIMFLKVYTNLHITAFIN